MDARERSILNTSQSNDIYRAIGEYIVKYEHLMHEIRTAILWLLRSVGLRNQKFSQILTSKTGHSEIVEQYKAMCQSLFELRDKDRKIFDYILKELRDVIEERNGLIHKVWYVGYGNEETLDFSEASGSRSVVRKGELRYQSDSITASGVDELTTRLSNIRRIFGRLSTCLSEGYSVRKNLILNADGSVSDPTDTGN